MAEKKKSVSQEEVKAAIEKTESVPMEELRYEPEPENANQRMDVFPELLAKSQPIQRNLTPTYGQIIPRGTCNDRACKLNVAKILAMQEAQEKMERQRRRRRYEIIDSVRAAAAILLSVGATAVCIAAVAYLGQFL